MKNPTLSYLKTLRHAATATLALVAMVSSASAQGITQITEIVTLRSGNDAAGLPLSYGSDDANVTQTSTNDPVLAASGSPAKVIEHHSAWTQYITDPDARWIHSSHNAGAHDGTGTNASDVLYAHKFDLPALMPQDATVTVEMIYAADDRLESIAFGDAGGILGITTPLTAASSYSSEKTVTISDTAQMLGVQAGANLLFVQQLDTGGSYSGVIYSVKITVQYCLIETEFRSGMRYSTTAGWLPFGVGSIMPNMRAVTLPEGYSQAELSNAFTVLDAGNGGVAVAVNANGAWSSLSAPSGWINSAMPSIGGQHHRSVLYALDFQLPASLPQGSIATLDLEWAVDDQLTRTFMNDIANPSLGLVANGVGPNNYSAPTTSAVAGTVSSLNLQPGANTLYLLQDDIVNQVSGINYIASLKVQYPCEGIPDVDYDTFCECVSDWGPCNNPGQPGQGCANSTGAGSRLSATGSGSNITLHADNLPMGQTIGLFFRGTNQIGPIQFGDGLRCVGGEVQRIKVVITSSGQADHGPVPAGSLYQFWYRDNSGPCGSGFNLSSAIAIP
ncbi:MAG: hypothetical protein MK291_10725 [Planctomycetes bacterium]|nr:hypothetical protein [Planctomycetota bacterium]